MLIFAAGGKRVPSSAPNFPYLSPASTPRRAHHAEHTSREKARESAGAPTTHGGAQASAVGSGRQQRRSGAAQRRQHRQLPAGPLFSRSPAPSLVRLVLLVVLLASAVCRRYRLGSSTEPYFPARCCPSGSGTARCCCHCGTHTSLLSFLCLRWIVTTRHRSCCFLLGSTTLTQRRVLVFVSSRLLHPAEAVARMDVLESAC